MGISMCHVSNAKRKKILAFWSEVAAVEMRWTKRTCKIQNNIKLIISETACYFTSSFHRNEEKKHVSCLNSSKMFPKRSSFHLTFLPKKSTCWSAWIQLQVKNRPRGAATQLELRRMLVGSSWNDQLYSHSHKHGSEKRLPPIPSLISWFIL